MAREENTYKALQALMNSDNETGLIKKGSAGAVLDFVEGLGLGLSDEDLEYLYRMVERLTHTPHQKLKVMGLLIDQQQAALDRMRDLLNTERIKLNKPSTGDNEQDEHEQDAAWFMQVKEAGAIEATLFKTTCRNCGTSKRFTM